MKLYFFRTLLLIALVLVGIIGCKPSWQIENPYTTVDWEKYGQYKANLHTHSMVSDGWMNPHTVVEKYHKAGYRILAISDHNSVTYPWEEFSKFEASDKTKQRIESKVLKPQEEELIELADLKFKDVKPSDMGMLAIQANELSSHHHMCSFFSDHNGTTTEVESLEATAVKNGITILNHPGRYTGSNPDHYNLKWYLNLFKSYNYLVGLESFNCGKRFPHDRQLWDSILTVMAPIRPVWGFSNDDMHSMRDFGRNWNVFLLPDLSEQEVRQAMEKGIFYFVYAPEGHNGTQVPIIKSIKVNQRRGEIMINASKQDSIVWISDGKRICRGNQLLLKELPKTSNYVRAELYGAEFSIVCTQPFIIKNRNNRIVKNIN
jgi:hypothetical protein